MSVLVCFSALQRVVGSIQGPFLWVDGAVLASSVCKKCQLCFLLAESGAASGSSQKSSQTCLTGLTIHNLELSTSKLHPISRASESC